MTFLSQVLSGHPVQTRDGRPAKFIAHVPDVYDEGERLIFSVVQQHGDCLIGLRREDGTYRLSGCTHQDIILAPEPPRVLFDRWMNIYQEPGIGTDHGSRELANRISSADRLYTAHLRFWSDGRVEQIKD